MPGKSYRAYASRTPSRLFTNLHQSAVQFLFAHSVRAIPLRCLRNLGKILPQDDSLAVADGGAFDDGESRLGGFLELFLELLVGHVAAGFGEQQVRAGFRSPRCLGEEARAVAHLMNHGKREGEVHLTHHIAESQGVFSGEADVYAAGKTRIAKPAFQSFQHTGLNVDGDHVSRGSDLTRELLGEEAHARPGFKHGHAFTDVRGEKLAGILPQATEGRCQKITEPPGADALAHKSPPALSPVKQESAVCPAGEGCRYLPALDDDSSQYRALSSFMCRGAPCPAKKRGGRRQCIRRRLRQEWSIGSTRRDER